MSVMILRGLVFPCSGFEGICRFGKRGWGRKVEMRIKGGGANPGRRSMRGDVRIWRILVKGKGAGQRSPHTCIPALAHGHISYGMSSF